MKIYQSEEDGVIGDLLYQTVEFSQRELTEGGVGVISQGAAQRYLAKERPDLKIKKCGSFKLDSQANTVTMRVGIVDDLKSVTLTGTDGSKIEGEKIAGGVCGDRKDHAVTTVKLLNPGYDELLTEVRTLRLKTAGREEMSKKCDELKTEHDNLLLDYKNRSDELKELQERYDALVIAVGKDAQKFSDLLVENERLQNEYDKLKAEYDAVIPSGPFIESTPTAQELANAIMKVADDEVDGTEGEPELVDVKKAIKKAIKPAKGSPEVRTHLAS